MPIPVFPPTFQNDTVGPNGEDLEATYLNGLFAATQTYVDGAVLVAEQQARASAIALALVLGS